MPKIFYFNPNTYSETAYVLAETVEEAKQKLLTFKGKNEYMDNYIENMIGRKDRDCKYTIHEGEVFFGEIS